jgi:hypothetical protein
MILNKLSKKLSRKNLYNLILKSFNENIYHNKICKVLNIGAGGDIKTLIKKNFKNIFEIDIDPNRKPDQIIDICDNHFSNKLKYKPNLVCIFEVLEHTTNPEKAINNIYKIIKKGDYVLASVPFIFHIHDQPYDYFRFTKFGLNLLFKKFTKVKITERNGWLETILVIFTRLEKEKNILSKLLGKTFIIISFLIMPLVLLLQIIFPSKKITTGYYIEAQK